MSELTRNIIIEKSWYIVRLYDGFDHRWIDVSGKLTKKEAKNVWNEKTENGIKHTKYEEIDYYDIFPYETTMLRS